MRLRRIVVFLALFVGFQNIRAYGQVVATWTDATGNWSNPANWSTLTVPNNGGGTTYSVTISAPGSVVTMDLGVIIDGLTLGATNALNVTTGDSLGLLGAGSSNGTLTNNGNLAVLGTGALANNSDASLINNGTIQVFGEGALLSNNSGASLINNGSILIGPFGSFQMGGTFVNNSKISAVGNSTMSLGGTNNGTILQESGHLSTAGTFNNTGAVTVFSGSDPVDFTIGGTFNNSGTLNVSLVNLAINAFSNSGTLNNTGTINLAYDCCFFTSFISNSGTINNSGVLNMSITNFGGGAPPPFINSFINSGTLNNTGTISNNSGPFSNAGVINNAGTFNNAGVFANSGAVVISSTGLFTTSTNYTQTAGSTLVNGTLTATNGAIVNIQGGTLGGTGTINGNVLMAGTMMPGDAPGTLTIFGNYEQTSTGIFKELMSPYAQAFLDVSGNVVLDPGALLEISLLGGFDPLGDTISIMDFSTLSGQFANGSSFWDDGFLWDITYRQHEIDVTAVQAPEPGTLPLCGFGLACLALYFWRRRSILSA